jgi:hypothetical protein
MTKTLSIKGPALSYSSEGLLHFDADCGGIWSDEEKAGLRWNVVDVVGKTVGTGGTGPSFHLRLATSPTGYALQVQLGTLDVKAPPLIVSVVGMSVKPYGALAGPIAATSLRSRALSGKNKRIKYTASIGNAVYCAGVETHYGTNIGLGLTGSNEGPRYSAATFAPIVGHWAYILEPTALVEGKGAFSAINSYDGARVTFGFVQFTLNQQDANLVLLLRKWLQRTDGARYFPGLQLLEKNGKKRIYDNAGVLLENDKNNSELLDRVNPNKQSIDDAEKCFLASLMHLARHAPETCKDQVELAVQYFKGYLVAMEGDGIDRRPDYICAVICDIRNQGRAKLPEIRSCLVAADGTPLPDSAAYEKLLRIGAKKKNSPYLNRVSNLRAYLGKQIESGVLGNKLYDENTGDFIDRPRLP